MYFMPGHHNVRVQFGFYRVQAQYLSSLNGVTLDLAGSPIPIVFRVFNGDSARSRGGSFRIGDSQGCLKTLAFSIQFLFVWIVMSICSCVCNFCCKWSFVFDLWVKFGSLSFICESWWCIMNLCLLIVLDCFEFSFISWS